MNNIVNLAIQVLPLSGSSDKYSVIDAAISRIISSGMKYKVCPFETVIEGPYDQIMRLVDDIQSVVFAAGSDEVLINMKLHRRNNRDVFIDEKTGKYDEPASPEGNRLGH